MAGTPDVTTDFDNKTELDFRRLIAKFAIPRAKHFWSPGFEATPRTALYPPADRVEELCLEVITETQTERAATSKLGLLLVEWGKLEERLLPWARQITERNVSVREAINALRARRDLPVDVAAELDAVRRVRNAAAHTPGSVTIAQVDRALDQLRTLAPRISWPIG